MSSVRVHTDREAAALSRALQARAFTVGHDIVFADGHFSPDSKVGMDLLAHEVAHAVRPGVGATASTLIQRSRWFHGQGLDVPRATYPAAIHDLGNGLYLSDRVDIGVHYANIRSPDRQPMSTGIRLSFVDLAADPTILNLPAMPEWQAYVADLEDLTGMPQAKVMPANEPYWNSFLRFLAQHDSAAAQEAERTGKLRTFRGSPVRGVIGPENLNGGLQMVIYDAALDADVQQRLRPIFSDLADETLGVEGAQANLLGTRSTVVRIATAQKGVIVEIDIGLTGAAAGRELPVSTTGERMKARLEINDSGQVTAIKVVEGPQQLVESLARQIVSNLSESMRSPAPSGGAGGTPTGGQIALPSSAPSTTREASSPRRLSADGGHALGQGLAMIVEAAANEWIGYVDDLNQQKAEVALQSLWPELNIALNRQPSDGAVLWQIFSRPKLGGATTFVGAGWIPIAGNSFAEAREAFDAIDFASVQLDSLETKTTAYTWIPPISSVEAPQAWSETETGAGWISEQVDALWRWLTAP